MFRRWVIVCMFVCFQRLVDQFQRDVATRVAVLNMRAAGVVCSYSVCSAGFVRRCYMCC